MYSVAQPPLNTGANLGSAASGVLCTCSISIYGETASATAGRYEFDIGTGAAASNVTEKFNSRSAASLSLSSGGGGAGNPKLVLLPVAVFSYASWRPHPLKRPVSLNGGEQNLVASVTSNFSTNALFIEEQSQIFKRISRRPREPGIWPAIGDSSISNHQKTGSGAYQIFAPHFDADAMWVDPSAWRNGSAQSDTWNINTMGVSHPRSFAVVQGV